MLVIQLLHMKVMVDVEVMGATEVIQPIMAKEVMAPSNILIVVKTMIPWTFVRSFIVLQHGLIMLPLKEDTYYYC